MNLEYIQDMFMTRGTDSENLGVTIYNPQLKQDIFWQGKLKDLLDAADPKNLKRKVGEGWPKKWCVVEIKRKFDEYKPKYNRDIVIEVM